MAKSKPETETAEPSRYAVYDETLLRYVGRVYGSKADAEKAAKSGPSGHQRKVREV